MSVHEQTRAMRVRYVLALLLVALMTVAGQLVIHRALAQARDDGHAIDIAGRQRMLSQRIAKNALRLRAGGLPEAETAAVRRELTADVELWRDAAGWLTLNVEAESGELEAIASHVDHVADHVDALLASRLGPSPVDVALIDEIAADCDAILPRMDATVGRMAEAANAKVVRLQRIETVLAALVLLVLVLEVRLVFRPAVVGIERTFDALEVQREKAMAAANAKHRFLANMSHEIRTPLNGMLGMSDLLLHESLAPAHRDQVATIRDSGQALLTVLNDILDLSKLEAGQFSLRAAPFEIRRTVSDVAGLMVASARAKGLAFELHMDAPEGLGVAGDEGRLRQVLLNLTSNAVRYTDTGSVRLVLRATAPDADGMVRVRVAVEDTGRGVPASEQARIFDEFEQAEGTPGMGGTGLGLPISRRLVRAMGGDISLHSEVGQGSTFSFELLLPSAALASESAEVSKVATTAEDGAAPLRVLVAEDNAVNQRVIRGLLGKLHCEVVLTEDGAQAVEAFSTDQAAPFDLILMDCHMPECDGYEATRQIRAVERRRGGGHTMICALTASVLQEDRDACLAAGMDDVLAKPLPLTELRELVNRARAA